ncbi:hypothetical protein QYM41_06245 [Kocuria sp. CPCC 205268]|uniref:hypothetical protein n=1 Tax=Kocuria oxytropis TaxID=3058913 RepID=UPI0034D73CE2
MDHRPAATDGHHEEGRALPDSPRERLVAALRDDRAPGRPGPQGTSSADGAGEDAPPRLPPEDGLEPVRRLGGRSWLVREARSGEQFVLRPCPQEPGPARDRSRAAFLSLAVALGGREEPCLVPVRGLLGPASAPLGLVEDFLPGGSLADRIAEHGRLAPGEAGALLRDAATGVAVLHALGRCHGELSPCQVLFRGTGSADGAGLPAAVRAGRGTGSPEDDVRDLGALGWAALTGRAPARGGPRVDLSLLCPGAPPGLVRAVEDALGDDPAARPTAAGLAERIDRAPEPSPEDPQVPAGRRAPGGRRALDGRRARGGRRATSGRRVRGGHEQGPERRRAVLVAVAVAAMLLAGGGAVLLPSGDPGPAPAAVPEPATTDPGSAAGAEPATTDPGSAAGAEPATAGDPGSAAGAEPATRGSPGSAADPRRALRELVARRGLALRTGDAGLLDEVYAPGAEAAAADRDTIARVSGEFRDLELEVVGLRDAPAGEGVRGTATLVAEVRVDGYPGDPGAVPSVAAAGHGWVQTVRVRLVEGPQGWRMAAVEPVAGAGSAPGRAPQDPERRAPEGPGPERRDPERQDPRG